MVQHGSGLFGSMRKPQTLQLTGFHWIATLSQMPIGHGKKRASFLGWLTVKGNPSKKKENRVPLRNWAKTTGKMEAQSCQIRSIRLRTMPAWRAKWPPANPLRKPMPGTGCDPMRATFHPEKEEETKRRGSRCKVFLPRVCPATRTLLALGTSVSMNFCEEYRHGWWA